jgi:carboxyl-terminal processing protease
MPPRGIRVIAGIFAGLILACALTATGAAFGLMLPRLAPGLAAWTEMLPSAPGADVLGPPSANATVAPAADRETLFAPFWEAWDIVHREFVDQPVDDTVLMRGAIRGLLDSLGDEHTGYMDPEEYSQANIPLEGEYEGIGAWVDTEAQFLTIIAPMPNSPAERAGLHPGDEIVAVDGQDVTGLDGSLVIRRVLGPAGSHVVLSIRREGEAEDFDVEVVREKIAVPSVESRMLDDGIAYVRLFSFSESTDRDLRQALGDLLAQTPQALILDLRGNGGGYLSSAVDVASEFIQDGTILTERYGDGREQTYSANGNGLATEIRLAVLVDAGSASASEIVAGAIQDYERALLIGETTFGKGSVQNWRALSGDGGAVRVTIARWFTPDDRSIQDAGLTPDIPVELTEDDFAARRDPQLDRAVEALLVSSS